MIALFELRPEAEKFAALEPLHDDDYDLFLGHLRAEPLAATWTPPRVRYIEGEVEGGKLVPDMPLLGSGQPVLNGRARRALEPLFEGQGEFLPLVSDEDDFWIFNVLTVVDLMDRSRTDGRFLSGGRVVALRRLGVRAGVEDAPPIFKIPQWLPGSAIITNEVVDEIARHGLTGLDPAPLTSN